jgi:hypothetical protein
LVVSRKPSQKQQNRKNQQQQQQHGGKANNGGGGSSSGGGGTLGGGIDWDQRYRKGWAYGKEPNAFLTAVADEHLQASASQQHLERQPGALRVLSLAEGQGRNVVHLARMGHECTAVDTSAVGLKKTLKLAADHGVSDLVSIVEADLNVYDPGTLCFFVRAHSSGLKMFSDPHIHMTYMTFEAIDTIGRHFSHLVYTLAMPSQHNTEGIGRHFSHLVYTLVMPSQY